MIRYLQHNTNNFLAGVYWQDKQAGVAFLDVSTGEFLVAEGDRDYIEKLVAKFSAYRGFISQGPKERIRRNHGVINIIAMPLMDGFLLKIMQPNYC